MDQYGTVVDALAFTSRGNWGSVYDHPMSHAWLRINICDKCVIAAAHLGLVAEGTPKSLEVPVDYRGWGPPPEGKSFY